MFICINLIMSFIASKKNLNTIYLSSCDMINKYNLLSNYKKPNLEKIVIEFPIKELLEKLNKADVTSIFQIKSFFLLYILYLQRPYISCNKQNFKNISINEKYAYSLKITLLNKENINDFLFTFFIENRQNIRKDKISKIEGINSKNIIAKKINTLSVFSYIYLHYFTASNYGLQYLFPNKTLRNIKLKINFVFKIYKLNLLTVNIIRNIPLFWNFK